MHACVLYSQLFYVLLLFIIFMHDTVQDSDEQTFWLHLELNASSSSAVVILHSKLYIFFK